MCVCVCVCGGVCVCVHGGRRVCRGLSSVAYKCHRITQDVRITSDLQMTQNNPNVFVTIRQGKIKQ